MTYGYSDDLRIAALSYYDREGVSQKDVSVIFGVSLKTLGNWVRLRKEGNFSRRSAQKKRESYKLDEAELRQYISDNPDAYNREVSLHFGVHPTSIFYARKRLGLTRKKNDSIRREK
jgi:transposase